MSRFNQNRSQYDPTLKEHFTEEEARRWIRHLEKIIESHENRWIETKQKNYKLAEKNTHLQRKIKRLVEKLRFLQEQHPEIDFGIDDFSKEQNL